uniref:Uncharacterized protein n=1 Tax=Picea sitchensis TaxID=3332 RepID=A9P1F1_PICSI|nr:unknown [Picea sitchensis]
MSPNTICKSNHCTALCQLFFFNLGSVVLSFQRPPMAALRAVCRPHLVSSFISCSRRTPFNYGRPPNCRSNYVFPRGYLNSTGIELGFRSNGRRMFTRASARKSERTPYESLGKFLSLDLDSI